MARKTNADLLQRISELEAEVDELRVEPDADAGAQTKPRRGWGWTVLAVALITIGSLLAPVAVVASWARVELTDTDRFVAAYAPLASVPAVQDFVAAQTVRAIDSRIDIPQITSDVIDGVIELGTGRRASAALRLLKAPISNALEELVSTNVQKFTRSARFQDAWTQALRVTHTQLAKTMTGDPNAVVAVGSEGAIGIQLAPIVAAAKKALIADGITFADRIPTINRTITVAPSSSLPQVQLIYTLAIAAGAWLPFLALLLLVAGVAVARRRALATIGAAIGLALTSGTLLTGFGVGYLLFIASVSPVVLPTRVADVMWTTLVGAMQSTAVAILALAIALAVVAYVAGPFRGARALRRLASSGADSLRGFAEERGVTTGRVGEWIYAQRLLLRIVVAAVAAAIVIFVRPVSATVIVWTLIGGVLVVAVLELLQRPTRADLVEVAPDIER